MRSVSIVVHVQQVPEALRATLDAVRVNTALPHELVVFADGADAAIENELSQISGAHILRHETQRGAAAILNRAFIETAGAVVVLLESGSVPGPGWLDLLLEPLETDSACGMSGPSTNMSWNEQGVFAGSGGSANEIAATAEQARVRFGRIARPLGPLYSLADFCYVVDRRVFDTIGPADEAYGVGPCWEMDYNVRAARAGLQGLWVCASYVYRRPFTPGRRQAEDRLFERNKQLYQSKFCGRQLRMPGTWYRPHCRGDECPEFAPAALLASIAPAPEEVPAPAAPALATPRVEVVSAKLVSCILPTYNRAAFIRDSVRMFVAQDYPHRELIIVDDGTEPISHMLPQDDLVRYFRLPQKLTIGAKRNYACNAARGEFIAHWDDDDWFPPSRLSCQVKMLEETGADLCGTSEIYYYDPENNKAFKYSYSGSPAWLTGLLYRRSLWERQGFDDIQIGEDTRFLWNPQPKRIHDMRDAALYLARMHRGNTSPKLTDCTYWRPVPVETVLPLAGKTVVSCIMLTRNRPSFVKIARELFERQEYPHKELLIVDNGEIPVADLAQGNPTIRYLRTDPRLSLGEKRSIAAKHAAGDIIVHWDDDDWYSPQRLGYQVTPILNGEADITGLENRFLLDLATGAFWTMSDSLHLRMFVGNVHGGTLAFHRRILNSFVDYPPINLAEDAGFLRSALQFNFRLLRLPNPGVYVYVRHARNTWQFQPGSFLDPTGWQTTRPPDVFPSDLVDRFRHAAGELGEATQWRH